MNNYIFFGSDDFSIEVLKVLIENNIRPSFVITQPDRPKGRNLQLTPPPIKTFCIENNIEVLQPEKLSDIEFGICLSRAQSSEDLGFEYFIVASYGKIISKEILDLPKLGTLNVHPSLLPKYRGASPIETTILNNDKKTGVTIMLMDEKMDHGPIIKQKKVSFEDWPNKNEVYKKMANLGGQMLVEIIPDFLNENINKTEQNHNEATFTKLIKKEDGEILDTDSDQQKWLKFIAYTPWPGTFYFINKNNQTLRIKITDAVFENNNFIIKKVIPEGKNEMDYKSFKNGYIN
jgi:methionyl-tRNA formyltransferase